jgi:PAS domain S-box-containing protein
MTEKPTYKELEQRIVLLEQESERRKRLEEINATLVKITTAINDTSSLDELYQSIHQALSSIIDTTNFYIALYDITDDSLTFPYIVDTVDEVYPKVIEVSKTASLTAQVIRSKNPLLLTKSEILALRVRSGFKIPPCTPSEVWLGVPLQTQASIIGVMAVQSYQNPNCYDQTDLRVMGTVAAQVAIVIARKKMEKTLRESEERNRLLSDLTMEGIVIEKNNIVIDLNASMAKMLGVGHDELLNKQFSAYIHVDDRPLVDPKIVRDYVIPQTIRIVKKNEEYFFAEFESLTFRKDGDVWRVNAVRDITERKRSEEQQLQLREQLIQAQKMESVGRLAGGVAHDFNNMLSVILGYTELALHDVTPDTRLADYLRQIFSAARHSADITRQLLAFARKQTIAPKILDFNNAVSGMLNMVRRLIGEDIDLTWLPTTNLWSIKMDPSQLDQILANLCINARDAISGVGKITIETENIVFDEAYCAHHPGSIPGEYVLLAQSDNGCGIDKETLGHIYEPFYTTKQMGKGTGLGLATVYGIVKQNKGFINVYSELGRGTTFKIYLPRHRARTEPVAETDAKQVAVRGDETILLVEDEPAILALTETMLVYLGYTVLSANTPTEAIHLAKSYIGQIQLLFTDVIMPEMNGRDLAGHIMPLHPHLKVLFMSGYTANVIAHHGVLDHDVQFIEKPFSKKDLATKIRLVLNGLDVQWR